MPFVFPVLLNEREAELLGELLDNCVDEIVLDHAGMADVANEAIPIFKKIRDRITNVRNAGL